MDSVLNGRNAEIKITDKKDANNNPAGTAVILNFKQE